METKPKKKKSGCLIAVIVLVLIGAVVAGGGKESEESAKNTNSVDTLSTTESTTNDDAVSEATETDSGAEKTTTEYEEGQYKIGSDMPAGVYVLYQQDYSWLSYFAITSDANGKDILKNDNFENRSVIEVVDGEYLEIKRCSAFPLEEDPGFGITGGWLSAGCYIVGRDIDPGEYKVEANSGEMAYICIYPDTRRSKIHANDNFEGSRYIALEEGQLFEIERGRVNISN